MSKFPVVNPTHEKKFSINNRLLLLSGVALGAVSLGVYSRVGVQKSVPLFIVTAVAFYSAISRPSVETEAFKKQAKAINELMDPCIAGVLAERKAKFECIKATIHDKPHNSKEEVKTSIATVAAIYDGVQDVKNYPEPLVNPRKPDQKSYDALVEAAKKLIAYDVKNLATPAIDSRAVELFKSLQSACQLFIHGDKNEALERDSYVLYGMWDRKAVISTLSRLF